MKSTNRNELVINRQGTKVHQAGADADLTDRLREAAEDSLYVLSKGILGMTAFTPTLHMPLCDYLQKRDPLHRVVLMPRDTFKTSMARCLGVHIVIQPAHKNPYFPGKRGVNARIMYAAETGIMAVKRILWIRRQFENNKMLRALWPHLAPWDKPRSEASTWAATQFTLDRDEDYTEATFEAVGVDSGSTGSHYDVHIKDDLIGLRSRQDPALMPRAIEWFLTSHSLSSDLRSTIDYVFGTRWAAYDLYSWLKEYETSYDWVCKQIIDDNFDDRSILFPERFDLHEILELERKQGELFYLNYMNKAVGNGTTAFDMRKAQYFDFDEKGRMVEWVESPATKQIVEMIEKGKTPQPRERTEPKKLWEMTGAERTEAWLEMQKRWYAEKMSSYEIN